MSPAPLSGSRTAAATVRGNVRAVCAPNNAIPSAQHCRRGHPTSPSTPRPSRWGHPHLHIRVARRLPGAGVGLVGVPATPHPNWLSGKGHCLVVGAVGSRPGREPGAPSPPMYTFDVFRSRWGAAHSLTNHFPTRGRTPCMTVAGGGTTPPARRPRGRVLAWGGSLAEKGQTAEHKAGVSTDGRPDPQAAASARMTVVESRRRRDPMFIGPHEAELLTGGESVPLR